MSAFLMFVSWVLVSKRRRERSSATLDPANQPFFDATLSPPIEAPLPGALVKTAVMGSPAKALLVTCAGESCLSRAFSVGVAG